MTGKATIKTLSRRDADEEAEKRDEGNTLKLPAVTRQLMGHSSSLLLLMLIRLMLLNENRERNPNPALKYTGYARMSGWPRVVVVVVVVAVVQASAVPKGREKGGRKTGRSPWKRLGIIMDYY